MRVRKTEDEPFEINLIPMIDCMLVIIIFFLVATTLKQKDKETQDPPPELAVVLPDSLSALTTANPSPVFVIGIDRAGRVYLGSGAGMEPADNVRLHRELRELAGSGGAESRVRIDADRDTRYEDIIRVLDLCAFEGLRNVGFHTQKAPPR